MKEARSPASRGGTGRRPARALLALFAAALAASPARAEDGPALRIERCEPVDAAELAAALGARLGRTAEELLAAGGGDARTWTLDIVGAAEGAILTLVEPAGASWERTVGFETGAAGADRVRAIALASEYLLTLSRSPFVAPPVEPPAPLPEPPLEVLPVPPAVEPSWPRIDRAVPPVEEPPPDEPAPELRIDAEILVGGASDLSYSTRGDSEAFALGMRPQLEWDWGLWVEAEVEWHFAYESTPESLQLHQLPIRLGFGAVIPAEIWRIRLAFQGVVEPWWTTGGTARSGWRTGGGFLVSGAVRPLPWLSAGIDLGVELLPHGIELIYGDLPVFSLGSWRWRGLAWIGFGGDVGV
jgi:hypothetical protein